MTRWQFKPKEFYRCEGCGQDFEQGGVAPVTTIQDGVLILCKNCAKEQKPIYD